MHRYTSVRFDLIRLNLTLCALCLLLTFSITGHAQSKDYQVDVLVADRGDDERKRAYRVALDSVLRRQVETQIQIDREQRREIMSNASLYIKTARYRQVNPSADSSRASTRAVRDSGKAAAVLVASFSSDLAAIIQNQLVIVAEPEEIVVDAPVIALVAVEQQGSQFIIGGERGKKFQARAIQLATVNNLLLQFPEFTPADLELIAAEDILFGETERINNFVSQFEATDVLTGAIYQLSSNNWQSDWSYVEQGKQPQSYNLTTTTLDEALVSVMSQISSGGGFASPGYLNGTTSSYQLAGVAVRIESINSLNDYATVLSLLTQLDNSVVTESLEDQAMVFRVSDDNGAYVSSSLASSRQFEALNTDPITGELSFRYQGK